MSGTAYVYFAGGLHPHLYLLLEEGVQFGTSLDCSGNCFSEVKEGSHSWSCAYAPSLEFYTKVFQALTSCL